MTYTAINKTPRIYVACIAAYNEGHLHGVWIDIDTWTTEDDVMVEIDQMLKNSPVEDAEEWEINDHEYFDVKEVSSIQEAIGFVEAFAEVSNKEAFAAFWDEDKHSHASIPSAVEDFKNRYIGKYNNQKNFVVTSEEIDSTFNYKQFKNEYPFWANYINWDQMSRELFPEYYTSIKTKGGIYVFRAN